MRPFFALFTISIYVLSLLCVEAHASFITQKQTLTAFVKPTLMSFDDMIMPAVPDTFSRKEVPSQQLSSLMKSIYAWYQDNPLSHEIPSELQKELGEIEIPLPDIKRKNFNVYVPGYKSMSFNLPKKIKQNLDDKDPFFLRPFWESEEGLVFAIFQGDQEIARYDIWFEPTSDGNRKIGRGLYDGQMKPRHRFLLRLELGHKLNSLQPRHLRESFLTNTPVEQDYLIETPKQFDAVKLQPIGDFSRLEFYGLEPQTIYQISISLIHTDCLRVIFQSTNKPNDQIEYDVFKEKLYWNHKNKKDTTFLVIKDKTDGLLPHKRYELSNLISLTLLSSLDNKKKLPSDIHTRIRTFKATLQSPSWKNERGGLNLVPPGFDLISISHLKPDHRYRLELEVIWKEEAGEPITYSPAGIQLIAVDLADTNSITRWEIFSLGEKTTYHKNTVFKASLQTLTDDYSKREKLEFAHMLNETLKQLSSNTQLSESFLEKLHATNFRNHSSLSNPEETLWSAYLQMLQKKKPKTDLPVLEANETFEKIKEALLRIQFLIEKDISPSEDDIQALESITLFYYPVLNEALMDRIYVFFSHLKKKHTDFQEKINSLSFPPTNSTTMDIYKEASSIIRENYNASFFEYFVFRTKPFDSILRLLVLEETLTTILSHWKQERSLPSDLDTSIFEQVLHNYEKNLRSYEKLRTQPHQTEPLKQKEALISLQHTPIPYRPFKKNGPHYSMKLSSIKGQSLTFMAANMKKSFDASFRYLPEAGLFVFFEQTNRVIGYEIKLEDHEVKNRLLTEGKSIEEAIQLLPFFKNKDHFGYTHNQILKNKDLFLNAHLLFKNYIESTFNTLDPGLQKLWIDGVLQNSQIAIPNETAFYVAFKNFQHITNRSLKKLKASEQVSIFLDLLHMSSQITFLQDEQHVDFYMNRRIFSQLLQITENPLEKETRFKKPLLMALKKIYLGMSYEKKIKFYSVFAENHTFEWNLSLWQKEEVMPHIIDFKITEEFHILIDIQFAQKTLNDSVYTYRIGKKKTKTKVSKEGLEPIEIWDLELVAINGQSISEDTFEATDILKAS